MRKQDCQELKTPNIGKNAEDDSEMRKPSPKVARWRANNSVEMKRRRLAMKTVRKLRTKNAIPTLLTAPTVAPRTAQRWPRPAIWRINRFSDRV